MLKAEAALVKEQQDREEACGVFQNTIRMLEAENARLMDQQHEQHHATSKEETRLQKALETQARVSKRMEQALTEEVSKLEESRESLRAEHHTHVEDLEAARAREALNSEQVMAKETEKKRLEKELSKYHSRLTRHEVRVTATGRHYPHTAFNDPPIPNTRWRPTLNTRHQTPNT